MTDDVRIERLLPADPQQVYDAWTRSELLEQWYCPNPALDLKVEADVQPGGGYVVAMGPHVVRGTYGEVESPRRLTFDWLWDGDDEPPTQVVVQLTPSGDQTLLQFSHTGFGSADEAENHRIAWEPVIERLDTLLRREAE